MPGSGLHSAMAALLSISLCLPPSMAGAQANPSLDFPPDSSDPAAAQCDALADRPDDPHRVGDGVGFEQIETDQALAACGQAAERAPARPRYRYLYGRALDAAKRYPEAAAQYGMADQAGYGFAAAGLGRLYYGGVGVPVDLGRARDFYDRAGNAGIADGFNESGMIYAEQTPADYAAAKDRFERAAEGGVAEGYTGLGRLYEGGFGVPKQDATALSYYLKAAQGGSVDGMFRLGLGYHHGLGGSKDPAAGCEWLQKAAEAGHAYAQQETGRCYYTGDGVAEDHAAAFTWFAKAGQARLIEARVYVADMLDRGDGWNLDKSAAIGWYHAAADQGDAYAMTQLGAHLRLGEGIDKNEAEAMQWFAKAAAMGYVTAETSLAIGYENRRDYALAAHWFDLAAQQGNSYAELSLGEMYDNGWGVPRDPSQARQLYARALRSDNEAIADRARQHLASGLPTHGSSASSDNSTDFWTLVVVGALAITAVSALTAGNSSSTPAGSSTIYDDMNRANAQMNFQNCMDLHDHRWAACGYLQP